LSTAFVRVSAPEISGSALRAGYEVVTKRNFETPVKQSNRLFFGFSGRILGS
jgi:hypothetical protein